MPKPIRIRMYRQGLGDAFLIRIPKTGGHNFHILIDCGVFIGTTSQSANMRAIAENVKTETGARLDVLVATHQHWDHLSGFQQAREIWDTIAIEELWLAWTEEPGNPVADELRGERTRLRMAARAAVAEMRARGANATLRAGI
ncbi:MAG: MBL fold metallo-hydrolase, partial [Chthoniobacteraceae bacterium]